MAYSKEDITLAVEMLEYYHGERMKGARFPYPVPLIETLRKIATQVALEAIVVDGEGNYMLARRPAGETKYGGPLLYAMGGFITPNHCSMRHAANIMARTKHNLAGVTQLSGPIAQYFWKPGEHPEAHNLISILYVFLLEGTKDGGKDVEWLPIGTFPKLEELIAGRPGKIHMGYIKEFHRWHDANEAVACRDLNIA